MSKVTKTIYLPPQGSFNAENAVFESIRSLFKEAIYPYQPELGSTRQKPVTIIIEVLEQS